MKDLFFKYCILAGLIVLCISANAQEIRIVDKDLNPVSMVQVYDLKYDPPISLISNSEGIISAQQINPGDLLVLRSIGFVTDTVIFQKGMTQIQINKANYDLGEVVITAQYRPTESSRAVHSIRTIGADEIEQRAAINLSDVLKNELNFSVSQDNILGTGLSMQGISGENVKIMIDGVPVIGRLDGNIDVSQLNLNQIERIEIVEGPLAVNYGSNALAGTINLITKAPKTNELGAGANVYTESIGHYNATAFVSMGWEKQSISLSGGRNYFDGWNPGDDVLFHQRSLIADDSRFQQWKPREQLFADAKYNLRFKNGYTELAGSWFDEEIINRGVPRGAYKESAIDDRYNTNRANISGKVQFAISKKWNSHHILAYSRYERIKSTFVTDLTGVSSELSSNASLQDTSAFSAILGRGSFIGALTDHVGLQLGYEVEVETAEGKKIVDETGSIENYALFATSEWKPSERFTLRPGIRWAYNSRYDAPLIPSINLMYQLPSSLMLRASYAQGFRAPGLKELSFLFVDVNHNIQGNPDLRAEASHNFSASLTANKDESRKIGWTVSGFYNKIHNLITFAETTTALYTYVNIGEQETLGGRANADLSIKNLTLGAGFAYTGVSSQIGKSLGKDDFLYTPEATVNVGYAFEKADFQINAIYKFNGKRNFFRADADGGITQEYIESYQNLDVTLAKKFFKNTVGLELGAKNIFDVQQLLATANGGVHSGGGNISVGTGRSYFVRLSIAINKMNQ